MSKTLRRAPALGDPREREGRVGPGDREGGAGGPGSAVAVSE